MLAYEIKNFLAQYHIDNASCGRLYEQYLLNSAEIENKPETKVILSENNHIFMIKGLDDTSARKLVKFINKHGDQATACKLVDGKVSITTDADIALKHILPRFKKHFRKFAKNNPEKIKEYQAKSKEHFPDNPTRLQALYSQAEKTYMENPLDEVAEKKAKLDSLYLPPAIREFLEKYNINTQDCDIFEETILKMAGIETSPLSSTSNCGRAPFYRPCVVSVSEPTGTGRISFTFIGLTTDDAVKLAEYFIQNGDATVAPDEHFNIPNHEMYHFFNVNASVVYDKVFPAFKAYIQQEVALGSKRLDKYRELSKSDSKKRSHGRSSFAGLFRRCFGYNSDSKDEREDKRTHLRQ